jgi:hypothetical protein
MQILDWFFDLIANLLTAFVITFASGILLALVAAVVFADRIYPDNRE